MKIKKLGPYKLLSVLGRGGMGTVYRAQNQETGNYLAVKVLAEHFSHDPHFRNRFESEIKALIKLNHPNIVRLISYGQEDATLYFAMELVEGKNLFQLQRDGKRFDWREVLSISRDIAQGLRHAHDRGVIHRDLKPGNLLASEEGLIKITDFGIAKNFGANSNTGTNVLGTMDFMSPEQAKGDPVTVKSDLYSLGSVMYCLLSGRPPHRGNSVEESLHNLTRPNAPRIIQSVPNVPTELDGLISRLMEPDPQKRLPTAQSLLHRIEQVEQQLKDYSEAQTAERPIAPSHDKFAIGKPVTSEQKSDSSYAKSTAIENPNALTGDSENQAHRKTQANTVKEPETPGAPDSGAYIDYFNTVTEQQRQRQTGEAENTPRDSWRNIAWTGTLFILAVGLIVAGTILAYRRPSAEQLYAKIIEHQANPQKSIVEIRQFLEFYPDNEQADQVRLLKSEAEAIALRQRLTIQSESRMGNSLTEIEKQFVEIMELSRKDIPAAYSRLKALVTLYGGDGSLNLRDKVCIEASQVFLTQLKNEAEEKQMVGRGRIESLMQRAKKASPAEAAQMYRSIIELYGESSWAAPLIETAKRRLATIEQE
ncbi:MAG: serine/threonine-protein kinase [Planctomycetota bacterium]|nr:serine/threonine-protein kinase [Planctomycetota bacterium]